MVPRTGILAAFVCVALVSVVARADDKPTEMPPSPQPTDTSMLKVFTEALMPHAAEINANLSAIAAASSGRRLQQARLPDGSLCCPTKPIPTALPAVPANDGVLTYPDYLNARCQFNVQGNGQYGVITSATINCETADGTDVLMYMGSSMLAFAANFKGVYPVAAQPGTINIDPNAIFLVQSGSLEIYGSTFNNIAVGKDFPLITLTVGTTPVLVTDSTFNQINTCVGDVTGSTMCLPVIAATDFTTYVQIQNSQFTQNTCLNPNICHSGAVYITDRATSVFRGVSITGSIGHFGAGLMVTDGANFKAYNSIFASNAVTVYGSLGAAIWLSACKAYSPAYDQITGYGVIQNSFIASNYVYGSGGGLMVSDCPNTKVDSTIFYNNQAYLVGGAISVQGASPNQAVTNSFFINNVAQTFFGGAVSQEPCDPTFVATNNVLYANSEQLTTGTTGCSVIETATNGNAINTNWPMASIAAYNAIVASIPGLSG